MRTDTTCAGAPFDELKRHHPAFVERMRLWADAHTGISQQWAQTSTARMWLWLLKNRAELMDGFMVFSEPLAGNKGMEKAFSGYAERLAAEQGVNVYTMLFGVSEHAEKMLNVDDMAYSMTTLWFLREMPEEMLLTFADAPELPLSKFGTRAFGPKDRDGEAAYLKWRFGSVENYALHVRGLLNYSSLMVKTRGTEEASGVAISAVILGIPPEYALPLAASGYTLSAVQRIWAEKMPVEYALALSDKGGMA